MTPSDITPLILTFNEAANIERTLARLTWAARVVVVDSFSTDDTVDICRRYANVDVVPRRFDEFLYGIKAATTSDATFTWVDGKTIVDNGLEPWSEIPVWMYDAEADVSQTWNVDVSKALAHGLKARPMRETVADIGTEGMRYSHLAPILREALDDMHIKTGDVNYAVPGQSVFARFVKLPSVDEEKIERIISFEAQQNVPFPIDEVVWDYQLVGAGSDEQIQVVLVAIKADLLDEINGAVEASKLRTNIVDVVINHLRKKIDASHKTKLIHTIRGVGYVIRADGVPPKGDGLPHRG